MRSLFAIVVGLCAFAVTGLSGDADVPNPMKPVNPIMAATATPQPVFNQMQLSITSGASVPPSNAIVSALLYGADGANSLCAFGYSPVNKNALVLQTLALNGGPYHAKQTDSFTFALNPPLAKSAITCVVIEYNYNAASPNAWTLVGMTITMQNSNAPVVNGTNSICFAKWNYQNGLSPNSIAPNGTFFFGPAAPQYGVYVIQNLGC